MLCDNIGLAGVVLMSTEKTQKENTNDTSSFERHRELTVSQYCRQA